ncbi:carbohydrate ABC transporter permease [Paenibacillus sp. PAMC21692]|uniref:carbohydrate ABC transporter permease n=1 Tax=Paenibacillus sp. PAMC21692 TaxID=2762320 RepID=UPI00164E8037|nr:carbohydrate ABC transporter permease [Paenibacillus sp. PAMC21692]QNK57266.1 carbohydrate ABC transporter permease [Paenibacillus sp. PAMC21692]
MRRRLRKLGFSGVMLFVGLTGLAVFMLIPIVYIFNHAFKPLDEMFLFPPRILVEQPTMANFDRLFFATSGDTLPFTRYLFNSVLIVTATVLAVIAVSSTAAYAIAKLRFGMKGVIMALIYISLMFAAETVSIPRYLIISALGINDTYFAHILPFLASPVAVFLMMAFIGQIPNDLIEAAKLDGASEATIFARIVMPLAAPAVATIAILTFQGVWGDVEASTLYVQDEALKNLAYYVSTLVNGAQNNVAGQGLMAAASLLMFVPNLIIFLMFQKRVMETMLHSGVK